MYFRFIQLFPVCRLTRQQLLWNRHSISGRITCALSFEKLSRLIRNLVGALTPNCERTTPDRRVQTASASSLIQVNRLVFDLVGSDQAHRASLAEPHFLTDGWRASLHAFFADVVWRHIVRMDGCWQC